MKRNRYGNLTVLCIDDEMGIRRRIVQSLSYFFGTVLEASDGNEAWLLYEEHVPDLILCDVEMPVMNGIEFIKKVRQQDLKTPIVMLTAYSNEEYLLKLINLNIQHYILKPVNAERLIEGIEAGLRNQIAKKIKLGDQIFLDAENNLFIHGEDHITLSDREAKFLALLGNNSSRIVDYATIETEVWVDRHMTQGALKSFVRDLRKKIGMELFENVFQRGYCLVV